MSNQIKKILEKERSRMLQKHGAKSVAIGNERYALNVVPTPSRMVNYQLGIGGFPYGHMVEIFGVNGLGKTSVMGYGTLANVQKQGKIPAVIAVEPAFDPDWAELYGVDPELLLIGRPENAEEAFEMLHDWVYGGDIDYIMVDSIGAMASQSETQDEAGKKKAYGASGVITAGLNAVMPRMYKNNVGLCLLNQQRQTGNYNGNTLYESPGGEGLKHDAMIRIHLKPGGNKFTAKIDGETVPVGREVIAVFKKNKLAQAVNKTARFDYYHIASDTNGIGVDVAADVLKVGKMLKIIEGEGWLEHHSFPNKINGKKAFGEYIAKHPEALAVLDAEVTAKMMEKELAALAEKEINGRQRKQ